MSVFIFKSPAFQNGDVLPVRFSGDDENISPSLYWAHAPQATTSLVQVMLSGDLDGIPIVHWLFYNTPSPGHGSGFIAEGANPQGTVGFNSSGTTGYDGPRGNTQAKIEFRLYPVKVILPVTPLSWDEVQTLIKGHIALPDPQPYRTYTANHLTNPK